MLRQKRIFAMLTAVLVMWALCLTASAQPVPDLSRKGSVKIVMPYENTTASGGSMTLYRVGAVRESNGSYDFVLTGDFKDCGIVLNDIQSAGLAKKLADYAADAGLTGDTQKIDGNGNVSFPELETGLYLLVQVRAADGYQNANPFLVSVPMLEEGVYVYDVQASPKVELTAIPSDAPKPDISLTPAPTSEPKDPTLPQTGQLNWPIPILAALGLGMFSCGWILRYGKRNDHEK